MYISLINGLLRSVKSNTHSEFIKPCPGSISIVTNNVLAPSDLSIIKKHFKLIGNINEEVLLPSYLSQSKSYLKITGILFIQPNGNKLTYEDIINSIQHSTLFEMVSLATKPRVIKVLPKSDMAIMQIDIQDSQNGSKAKLLVNYFFNFGQYIATIRGINMNPGILQCYNCQKWGHSTFLCRANSLRFQKYSDLHRLEYHRDMAWYCKANPKTNLPRLETRQGKPCPHSFKCINCKGEHLANNHSYLF